MGWLARQRRRQARRRYDKRGGPSRFDLLVFDHPVLSGLIAALLTLGPVWLGAGRIRPTVTVAFVPLAFLWSWNFADGARLLAEWQLDQKSGETRSDGDS